MMMDEQALRAYVCQAAYQLWLRGLIVGAGGMVSVETHRHRYVATPPGVRRSMLRPADLLCVDVGGSDVEGGSSIEPGLWRLHRLAYQAARPELGAAPASNPIEVRATAFVTPLNLMALMRLSTGAASAALGEAGVLPLLHEPDDHAVQRAVAEHGAAGLAGAGLLVAGADLAALLNQVEALEHAAGIELKCRRGG
jgi:L-fuculose-phosphate aldolase